MASKLFSLIAIIHVFLLLPFVPSQSLADSPPNSLVAPVTLCKSTPDPSYCQSVLPGQPASVYDYGRYSIQKSLSQSKKFLDLLEKYLARPSNLTIAATRALVDCRMLASLNMDFLSSSFYTVNTTNNTLPSQQADDVQTLLSTVITNQQTCLDGLQSTDSAWNVENVISVPLSNDTKLYSLSLSLFTKGWVPKKKRGTTWNPTRKQLPQFRHGRLPLKMSDRAHAVYESVSRRKLIHTENNPVFVSDLVIVSKNGNGNFTTITDAVSAAPNNTKGDNGYFLIYVTAGLYEEYVSIPKNKKYLMMIGDGINRTVITGNRSRRDGWNTCNSATFSVVSPNFIAVNMTFRNTAGPRKGQAVAVRNGADLSMFHSCSFEAYQDTLYTHSQKQFYRECDIYGTVDFIFGNAAALFQNCNIYPRRPLKGQSNAITAQGRTHPNQNTGIYIQNCTIRAADDLASSKYRVKTYLGRPWKEYSTTVYMQTFMDSLINPAGWHAWKGDFALNTLYYAEYNNTGPGSNTTKRVRWPGFHIINSTNAANFTVSNFLMGDGWTPDTRNRSSLHCWLNLIIS